MKLMLLILLISLFTLSTPAVDRVIDQAKGAPMTPAENNADSALARADETFQARDYQTALTQYEEVVKLAREQFNRSVETEGLAQIARMNLLLGEKEKGRESLTFAEQRADDADPYGWSRYLGVKGRFEWKDGELAKARKSFEQMYSFCQANSLYSRAIDAAHMVAIVAETPEDQIAWGKLGIEAAEKTENERWLGPLWNNLAGTYHEQKDYQNALDCYLKARKYHWHYSDETAKLFADYHVGMTYRLLGDYDNAGQWLRPVLAWSERLGNHSAIGQACEDLGEIEAAKGNKKGALAYFKRAREEYQAEGFDKNWQEIWNNINDRIAAMQ